MLLAILSIIITVLIPLAASEYLIQFQGAFNPLNLLSHQPLLCLAFLISSLLSILLIARAIKGHPVAREADPSSGAVTLLSLLQAKGRLIDFAMENIQGLNDEEIAGAARTVHAGCNEVLKECFSPAPIANQAEGSAVENIIDLERYKLVGKVSKPPYNGVLLHPGWKADKLNLPTLKLANSSPKNGAVISPAEIEIR